MLSNQDRVFADEGCNSLLWTKDKTFLKFTKIINCVRPIKMTKCTRDEARRELNRVTRHSRVHAEFNFQY